MEVEPSIDSDGRRGRFGDRGGDGRVRRPLGDVFSQPDPFTPLPNQIAPATHHTLQWDSRKGRWGIDLDVTQPTDRQADWRDAQLGLNYRWRPASTPASASTSARNSRRIDPYLAPRTSLRPAFAWKPHSNSSLIAEPPVAPGLRSAANPAGATAPIGAPSGVDTAEGVDRRSR